MRPKFAADLSGLLLSFALALALAAYTLPWMTNPGASLTFGGYDLAEWASLHPDVRAMPLWMTSLLLRLQPAILALLLALNASRPIGSPAWCASALIVCVTAAALLPPWEFFSQTAGDGNHQQQFGVALIALGSGFGGLSGWFYKWRLSITFMLTILGAATSLIALVQANLLMSQFQVPSQVGWGGLMFIAVNVTLGLSCLTITRKQGDPH